MNQHDRSQLAEFGPFWSSAKVIEELGLADEAALAASVEAGAVLEVATADDDVTLFPVSQFVSLAGHTAVRPGLSQFFRTLRHQSPWAVLVLLHAPAPELDDMSPLAWTRSGGDQARLTGYADQVAREWR